MNVVRKSIPSMKMFEKNKHGRWDYFILGLHVQVQSELQGEADTWGCFTTQATAHEGGAALRKRRNRRSFFLSDLTDINPTLSLNN